MKLLLRQQLAAAGVQARRLAVPAGATLRLPRELGQFQGWLDKVWRKARKR